MYSPDIGLWRMGAARSGTLCRECLQHQVDDVFLTGKRSSGQT